MLSQISEQLQKGKAKVVKQLVQEALDAGTSAQEILEKGLIAGMSIVGEKFRNNEIFVPEVLVAARALNMGAALLKPLLAADGVKAMRRIMRNMMRYFGSRVMSGMSISSIEIPPCWKVLR